MLNSVSENLEIMLDKLENFSKTETIIGEPVIIGEITLVPMISVILNCGGGMGTDGKKNGSSGIGIVMGARVAPSTILVIKKNEVSMLPVKDQSCFGKLVSMLPEIISKLNTKKDTKSCNKYTINAENKFE